MTTTPREIAELAAAIWDALCEWDGRTPDPILATLLAKQAEDARDATALKGLRSLMGFVEDGSDTVVTLFQDDATREYFVKVGERRYFATSFIAAIDAAMDIAKEPSP